MFVSLLRALVLAEDATPSSRHRGITLRHSCRREAHRLEPRARPPNPSSGFECRLGFHRSVPRPFAAALSARSSSWGCCFFFIPFSISGRFTSVEKGKKYMRVGVTLRVLRMRNAFSGAVLLGLQRSTFGLFFVLQMFPFVFFLERHE